MQYYIIKIFHQFLIETELKNATATEIMSSLVEVNPININNNNTSTIVENKTPLNLIEKRKKLKLNQIKSSTQSTNKSSIDNFSKSIDSTSSLKRNKNNEPKLAKLVATKSFDLGNNRDESSHMNASNLILPLTLKSPQRSIDYPCILRKTPKLSDIVRKRLLYQKVCKGINMMDSMEKEHVPKTPRKIIIRQDNSIEISITRPPRIRHQTISEDSGANNFTPLINFDQNGLDGSGAGNSNVLPVANNPSMLSVCSVGNDRRKTIETCENIFLQSEESTKFKTRTPPSNPHRILLYKDKSDKSIRSKIIFGKFIISSFYISCLFVF